MASKKHHQDLRTANKALNAAQSSLVRDFVDIVKQRTKRGEVIVSTREVLSALGLAGEPELVAAVRPQLEAAGIQCHYADLPDPKLPTIVVDGQQRPMIGVTYRAPAPPAKAAK